MPIDYHAQNTLADRLKTTTGTPAATVNLNLDTPRGAVQISTPDLGPGASGTLVADLQRVLTTIGAKTQVTGTYGAETVASVKLVQARLAFPALLPTGVMDAPTRAAVARLLARADADAAAAAQKAADDLKLKNSIAKTDPAPSDDLGPGAKGSLVGDLQRVLITIGAMPKTPITSVYDDATVAAVKRVQTRASLTPTGTMTAGTRAVVAELRKAVENPAATPTVTMQQMDTTSGTPLTAGGADTSFRAGLVEAQKRAEAQKKAEADRVAAADKAENDAFALAKARRERAAKEREAADRARAESKRLAAEAKKAADDAQAERDAAAAAAAIATKAAADAAAAALAAQQGADSEAAAKEALRLKTEAAAAVQAAAAAADAAKAAEAAKRQADADVAEVARVAAERTKAADAAATKAADDAAAPRPKLTIVGTTAADTVSSGSDSSSGQPAPDNSAPPTLPTVPIRELAPGETAAPGIVGSSSSTASTSAAGDATSTSAITPIDPNVAAVNTFLSRRGMVLLGVAVMLLYAFWRSSGSLAGTPVLEAWDEDEIDDSDDSDDSDDTTFGDDAHV